MIFSSKQKLFQIPLAIVKQIKKIFVQKKIFLGGVRGPQIWCFWRFLLFLGPLKPPKNIFLEKNIFFICFTIARGIWNNFCFGLNIIFDLKKSVFSETWIFG